MQHKMVEHAHLAHIEVILPSNPPLESCPKALLIFLRELECAIFVEHCVWEGTVL